MKKVDCNRKTKKLKSKMKKKNEINTIVGPSFLLLRIKLVTAIQLLLVLTLLNFTEMSCWYLLISIHRKNVAACAKHYVGDGGTTEGINENNTVINRHGLLSIHMAGYYSSIIKGVSTVMISYSSWNGKKMHANRDLITGFLKKTLRFRVNTSWRL